VLSGLGSRVKFPFPCWRPTAAALIAPLPPYSPPLPARGRPIPRPPAADFTSQSRIWSVAAGRNEGEEPERERLRRRIGQHQATPRRLLTTTESRRSSIQPSPASPLASDPPSCVLQAPIRPLQEAVYSGGRPSAQLHHTRPLQQRHR
jgi:hypothetical protein